MSILWSYKEAKFSFYIISMTLLLDTFKGNIIEALSSTLVNDICSRMSPLYLFPVSYTFNILASVALYSITTRTTWSLLIFKLFSVQQCEAFD